MLDNSVKLVDLISSGYTLNEIEKILNISRCELYKIINYLNNNGFKLDRKYYYDGEIIYNNIQDEDINKRNSVNIITDTNSDTFRAILISDLHIGSTFECIDAWYKIYNYCVINGINIIINGGDFIDGINIGRRESKKHDNPLDQIDYAIKNYPYDKNILNFLVLGNHDIDSLIYYGIDFSKYLYEYRHDIVPLGYGNGEIYIKNDKILLSHPLCIGVDHNHKLSSNFLLLKGHKHSFRNIIGVNGSCSMNLPSLSTLFLTENNILPGAIDITIKFRGGYFDIISYKHLLVDNTIHVVNSIQLNIGHSKSRKFDGSIRNEEDFSKRRVLKK